MKKVLFILIAALSFPAFCDDIAPPEWILGDWAMKFEEEIMELSFRSHDILIDGKSVTDMMKKGDVTGYRQTLRNDSFFVRVDYKAGYWWEERFSRPEMKTEYKDKNYETGNMGNLLYWRREQSAPR